MEETVLKLLERVRKNDSRAFEELSDLYGGMINKVVKSFVRDGMTREDAEDLEQEAKLFLLKAARTYDSASGLTFGLYARICVKNGLVSLERKRKSLPQTADFEIEDMNIAVPDTTIDVDENESAARLLEKIRKVLSKNEIEVLNLRLAGLARAEIAGKLGVSVKSVDNAVSRIKQKLRVLLS